MTFKERMKKKWDRFNYALSPRCAGWVMLILAIITFSFATVIFLGYCNILHMGFVFNLPMDKWLLSALILMIFYLLLALMILFFWTGKYQAAPREEPEAPSRKIRLRCSGCGTLFELDDTEGTTKTVCPGCSKVGVLKRYS